MIFAEKLSLGFPSRSDVQVSSMQAKTEGNKKMTSIVAGDVLIVDATATVTKPSSANSCCIYGVATFGIQDFTVPVVTKGHVIANLDITIFTNIKVGEKIPCKKGNKDCPCSNIMVVQKLKAIKQNGQIIDAYELLIA